jgi:hypothetical protein
VDEIGERHELTTDATLDGTRHLSAEKALCQFEHDLALRQVGTAMANARLGERSDLVTHRRSELEPPARLERSQGVEPPRMCLRRSIERSSHLPTLLRAYYSGGSA